ncbi:hypothetical protein B0H17DRAFT_1339382 [Mycena rosella]|uniref:Uncharacterized protein n=1 Tax=Mycena rosella TaxID=1033263 RepID=A0AAD7FVV6_MYCRO|nr:hypothetical protein B0H17DRAFT_1339382 [Mycena rosella]
MARATRSSIQQDKSHNPIPDPKKRKRTSEAADGQPQKLQRTDAPPFAATRPIDSEHANKILHVLEMIDEQGLLDRVYPLEQSSSSASAYSLRTLLTNAQEHTLAALRIAVQNLLPISVHPRAPTPTPAAQQQRFCDVALSLLDQASFHPVSLDTESVLPQEPADDDGPSPVATSNKRYALVQQLPGGAYWTSVNLPLSAAPDTGPADLKDLPTGHAELVAVFPAPSATASTSALPTLAAYNRAPAPSYDPPRPKVTPGKRRVTRGSFLDYGPWASFAPSWVQDGSEVGMRQMGEVYAQRAQRYRERLQARERFFAGEQSVFVEAPKEPPPEAEPEKPQADVEALQDILSPAEIESLKSVLGSLELENAVQELLDRNRRALQRLGQLQVARLRAEGGRTSSVGEGDEEWDVEITPPSARHPRLAHAPRVPPPALVRAPRRAALPPPTVLHTLMQTLPRAAVPGWHGTLPARGPATATTTALRDDATVKVRPGAPATAPPPAPGPAAPYGTYYTPQAASRPTLGLHRYNSRQTPQPQQVQGQQQYYAPAAYAGSNQLPYGGYASGAGWYGGYGAAGAGAYAGGQPQQPQTLTQMSVQHIPGQQGQGQGQGQQSYGTFFPAGTGSGAATPIAGKAVANTVLGKASWGAGAGTQTPPVLPAHLRSSHYPA